jgi:hypothetical protein
MCERNVIMDCRAFARRRSRSQRTSMEATACRRVKPGNDDGLVRVCIVRTNP